ncbi:ribonuclease Z [Alkalicoccobacillus porphyridii]|uniref:Ribonuclease Z n=1 Tax=Alkalicoccobacillus porphyridii TaxID=2597270 RepID=A0A553ZZT7_9BACI|nr:ribonuclease Z [Alkalicoccobacillus porphyridii]TSB46964.1 ribonuclease Z [Alkalicoccobacillus porphyridii]
MEFHFLGTGAGVPSLTRNVSSLAVRFLQQKGAQWLFDCGEATQHQLMRSAISPSRIDRVFITHLHGDHIYGLPGFLGTRSFQGAVTPITIYGPPGLEAFIQASLNVSATYLRYELIIVEVEHGLIIDTDFAEVSVLALQHTLDSFAFRIKEKPKPGILDVEKLRSLNVEPGPVYQKLKQGESVELADGRILHGQEFLGPEKPGRVVVIAGDSKPVIELIAFAESADLLIHEATFRSGREVDAHEFGHSTIADAASIAKAANVKQLILTHISSRYVMEEEELKQEAAEAYEGTMVANDLLVYTLQAKER